MPVIDSLRVHAKSRVHNLRVSKTAPLSPNTLFTVCVSRLSVSPCISSPQRKSFKVKEARLRMDIIVETKFW